MCKDFVDFPYFKCQQRPICANALVSYVAMGFHILHTRADTRDGVLNGSIAHVRGVSRAIAGTIRPTEQRRQMTERDLLNERDAVLLEVPPLKDLTITPCHSDTDCSHHRHGTHSTPK